MPTVLVTGSAGFIGHHLCHRLLDDGFDVVGLDVLDGISGGELQERRLATLRRPRFREVRAGIEVEGGPTALLAEIAPDTVVHLAAKTGVRASIEDPRSYLTSNLAGTFELLEACRAHPPRHLLVASSSSVYGAATAMPYDEAVPTDAPLSFYAATKKASEAMAHSHAHLHGLPTTVFRFFTVYGPWGRPDMAVSRFTRAILEGREIDVYGHGRMTRDFTYVGDLVEAVRRLIDVPPAFGAAPVAGDSLSPMAPFRVVNVGSGRPVPLGALIDAVEAATGLTARRRMLPMQPGDVPATWARADLLERLTGYRPSTPIEEGVRRFVEWFRDHHGI